MLKMNAIEADLRSAIEISDQFPENKYTKQRCLNIHSGLKYIKAMKVFSIVRFKPPSSLTLCSIQEKYFLISNA